VCVVFAPTASVVQAQPEPPFLPNDNFVDAIEVTSLPFSQSTFMDLATIEEGEPFPSCFRYSGYENSARTVWYRFSPSDELKLAMGKSGWFVSHVVGVFTRDEAMNLVEFNCYWYYPWGAPNQLLTLSPGVTYWFQVISWNYELVEFSLSLLEPLSASIRVYPEAPVRGTSVMFQAIPEDPSFVSYNFENCDWQFGDGSNATGCYPQHIYTDAGNYTVEVTGYTSDGRSATASRVITVNMPEPPSASIYFNPYDPFPGENIWFYSDLYDPSGIGFDYNACRWEFGDGTTAAGSCSGSHSYSTVGDYTVTLRAYTYDGREAIATTVVPVRIHDVSIIKVTVPQSARAGQTRQIVVGVSNKLYPETVQVTLSKGGSSYYDEQIGVLTQLVPVRSGNRTTDFQFTYTFTDQDAAVGKVTFKAFAQLVNARDSYPSDNSYIALPTKVSGVRASAEDPEETPVEAAETTNVYLPAVANGQ
jgi:chitodextrinase